MKNILNHRHAPKVFIIIGTILIILGIVVAIGAYMAWWKPMSTSKVIKDEPTSTSVAYKITPFVRGLVVPWSMVFTSPSRMLVTERKGDIRIIENGQLVAKPLVTFPDVRSESEEGLMGLALDPNYNQNKYTYACMAYQKGSELADKVMRFKDNGNSTSEHTTIIEGISAAQFHAGCRLGFGPDNKLYISTGDATDRNIAQNINSLGGKILRINSDGTIPADNPFKGSPVWSFGHRNPQGFAWQAGTGSMYESEHGPSGFDGPGGGDEINKIEKGSNYGWPLVSHEKTKSGTVSPLFVFTPAIAPAGANFYNSSALPQFKGNFLVAALKGEGIYRFIFTNNDPNQIVKYEKIPDVNFGRIRDVIEGPDGNIYFATSNRDGRGSEKAGDDKILMISRL